MGYLDDIIEGATPKTTKKQDKERARFLTRYFLGLIGALAFIDEWEQGGYPRTMAKIKEYGYESSEMIEACEHGMFNGMGLTYRGSPDPETSELTYGLTYRGKQFLQTFKEIWPLLQMAGEIRRKKEKASKKAKATRVAKARSVKGEKASRR